MKNLQKIFKKLFNNANTDRYQSMMTWLMPFTFCTSIISSSLFIALFSYLLPSLKHSYSHLKNLNSTQIIIYSTLLLFFSALASSTLSVLSSFRKIALGAVDNSRVPPDLFRHRKRVNFAIAMLFIAQILLVLLSIYVGYKVYCPFNICTGSRIAETGVTDREQISKMLDDKLKWILKKDLAKDLMTIVETFLMIIHRLELPKVEVELDDILQKILTDNAFYQTSTAVRIFKFLLAYFGLILNSIVCGTIYWLLEYGNQLTRLILEDNSFDHADLYEDRVVGLKSKFNEPSSEDAELRDLNIRSMGEERNFMYQKSRQMYFQNKTVQNQFQSAQINPVHRNSLLYNSMNPARGYNSPATESTPMTSPENMGGNIQELDFDAPPANTTGIIELPFIGKSTENLSSNTNARCNSRKFGK